MKESAGNEPGCSARWEGDRWSSWACSASKSSSRRGSKAERRPARARAGGGLQRARHGCRAPRRSARRGSHLRAAASSATAISRARSRSSFERSRSRAGPMIRVSSSSARLGRGYGRLRPAGARGTHVVEELPLPAGEVEPIHEGHVTRNRARPRRGRRWSGRAAAAVHAALLVGAGIEEERAVRGRLRFEGAAVNDHAHSGK